MDHALRTISYIADIGDLVVLMARRRYVPQDVEEPPKVNRTPKMICHVFESDEVRARVPRGFTTYLTLPCLIAGSVHRTVYRTSFPSGLHGVPKSKRNRRP